MENAENYWSCNTLPQQYYVDPAIFQQELERFYFRSWICAGRAPEIPQPGDYFLREVGQESILLVRGADGQVRAFFNVCRHRGTRICTAPEGRFSGAIQCGYHGWTYGLDGQLSAAPHMEQPEFCRENYPLHGISAEIWDGHVFVNLDRIAAPLAAQLGDLRGKFDAWRVGELRMAARMTYDVKCNWKLLVVNYNECLHCPTLHPLLNRMTHYLSGENDPPAAGYIGGSMEFREGVETMSVDGKKPRACLPGLPGENRERVHYYTVYPNLFLSLHPDYVMTHTLWPQAVDQTRVICELHFHPDEMKIPGFDPSDAVEFWDTTNREDWRICELSQLGIQSRAYQPGPYSAKEGLPRAFDEMIVGAAGEQAGKDKRQD
jgi:phenylpropionate dioxygenase-like ring-hydroxylating dioxygenase large terminal subunit